METVFLTLLRISVNAGWLVLAVLFLRVVFRRAPGWLRCAFWGMVAACLICPVTVASPWSLRPDAGGIFENYIRLDLARSSVVLEGGRTGVGGLSFWSVAAVVWLVGMCAMFLYLFVSSGRLNRMLAAEKLLSETDVFCGAERAGDSGNAEGRFGTAPPRRIVQSGHIDSPFVFGVFRPLICLPRRMATQDRSYAIAHEQAHIDRKDHW